jgi:hypothetical protein
VPANLTPPEDLLAVFGGFPEKQAHALLETWARAVASLPGAEQCIAWNMPSLRIDGELVLDENGSITWNAADLLASDGLTLQDTVDMDLIEVGLTALINSITNSRTMQITYFHAKVVYA